MKKNLKNIVLPLMGLLLMMGLAFNNVYAEEEAPPTPEEALLALINQARHNPLAAAAEVGLDPEQVLADLPALAEVLQAGLSPLAVDDRLTEVAAGHTGDMFDRGYYASVSPDGVGYAERIQAAGYPAIGTGESLAMIIFANFINPEEAAGLIFQYMYQDELDPMQTEKRNILDPCLREVGISIQSGTLKLGGSRWNVYLATVDFGSRMPCLEGEIFELINQVRKNPLETAQALGLDPETLICDYPEWEERLIEGVPRLIYNNELRLAAETHAVDMLENGYFSAVSPDGRTVVDRVAAAGYSGECPFEAAEMLWRACLGHDDELLVRLEEGDYGLIRQLAREMVRNMMTCALRSGGCGEGDNLLFNADFTEIGLGVSAGVSAELETMCGDRVLLLAMDFGRRMEIETETQAPAGE